MRRDNTALTAPVIIRDAQLIRTWTRRLVRDSAVRIVNVLTDTTRRESIVQTAPVIIVDNQPIPGFRCPIIPCLKHPSKPFNQVL